jgi:2-phospho-L-lactate guanylyltransferase
MRADDVRADQRADDVRAGDQQSDDLRDGDLHATDPRWTVIIPVKPAATRKSRLGLGPELAEAIALDTVAAVVGCSAVDRVIVVTADPAFRPAGADIISEAAPAGITAAIRAGAADAGAGARAALLGDLPSLRSEDLVVALRLAAEHPRAFVPDHEGVGTTLVTAAPGVELVTAFGAESAERHRELGLVELVLSESTVSMDVDTREQLERARRAGLGPATSGLLSGLL